jgi:hypothetical protein
VTSHPDAPGWIQSIADNVKPTWSQSVAFILFGIGAITYAKHPEGSIEAQTAASVNAILRRVDRRKAAKAASDILPAGAPDATTAAGTAVDVTSTDPASTNGHGDGTGPSSPGERPTTGMTS